MGRDTLVSPSASSLNRRGCEAKLSFEPSQVHTEIGLCPKELSMFTKRNMSWLIALTLMLNLVFFGTAQAAATPNPLDACTGNYTVGQGDGSVTMKIYRGGVELDNATANSAQQDIVFHASSGSMTAEYHKLTGNPSVVSESANVIPLSQPTSSGPGVNDYAVQLSAQTQAAQSAIVLRFSADATGVVTYSDGSASFEVFSGGLVTRNEATTATPASFTFDQKVESTDAPFISNYYMLSGSSPMDFSATFSTYTPIKSATPPAGGGASWALKLKGDQMDPTTAFVTTFCGGNGGQTANAPSGSIVCGKGSPFDFIVHTSIRVAAFTLAQWGPTSPNRMTLLWYPNGGTLPAGFDGAIWTYATTAKDATACMQAQLKFFTYTNVVTMGGTVTGANNGGSTGGSGDNQCHYAAFHDVIMKGGQGVPANTIAQYGPSSAHPGKVLIFYGAGTLPSDFDGWASNYTAIDIQLCINAQKQFLKGVSGYETH